MDGFLPNHIIFCLVYDNTLKGSSKKTELIPENNHYKITSKFYLPSLKNELTNQKFDSKKQCCEAMVIHEDILQSKATKVLFL